MDAGRVAVSGANGVRVGLSAPEIGRAGALSPLSGLTRAELKRNRVNLSSGTSSEWLANGPAGVEQGFTISERPAGRGPLTISQRVSGNTAARVQTGGHGITFTSSHGSLGYTSLLVTDATGAQVPAKFNLSGDLLQITVQDAHARYPLSVDPEFQQNAELTASDGAADDYLGVSVSISGNTVVAGAESHEVGGHEGQGAVYVYTKPASGWANATQTAELTASDGAAGDYLGVAVAISGRTIVAGATGKSVGSNERQGAVYVYAEPAGGWANATQTAELTASDGAAGDRLGVRVAISGSTIVATSAEAEVGSHVNQGAAYVYTEPAGGWANATQTAKLTSSDGASEDLFGYSVAVSGSTIVVGATRHEVGSDLKRGAVYVYTEPAGGWANATQTAELTASDGAAEDELGESVSVSGSTIVAGSSRHTVGSHEHQGTVYVYSEPANGWANATQTAELTTSDGEPDDYTGGSVAISGSTIVAGSPYHTVESHADEGTAYVYTEPAGGWVNATQTAEFTGADSAADDYFGLATAISGSTITVGALYHEVHGHFGEGEVYVFHPTVTSSTVSLSLSPSSIAANGTATSTATFTVKDSAGNPVSGDSVAISSSGGQAIGPVSEGATPGTYLATITSSTAAGTATITATDTSVTPGASATATLTQTSTGSATQAPSNIATIRGVHVSSTGTITLTVHVPGAGTVNALGTHESVAAARSTLASELLEPGHGRIAWGRSSARSSKAGIIRLILHASSAGRSLLARHRTLGWALKVRVWVTYAPSAGTPRSFASTVRVLRAHGR